MKEIRSNPTLVRKQTTTSRKSNKSIKPNKPIEESSQNIMEITGEPSQNRQRIIEENSVTCLDEIKQTLDNEHQQQESRVKMKAKYLHFDKKTYRRPPYYGTWRKNSKFISARNPFGKDEVFN